MITNHDRTRASLLAGLFAALMCTATWLGAGMTVLLTQGGAA